MNVSWWELSRSSGIVATVLLALALVWGFRFSARATGVKRRPNWWLDLHNYLGGLALFFTVVHVAAVYFDHTSGLGLVQVFVPFTADGWRWGITWGVVAMYGLVAVVFTTWPRKLLGRRNWLIVHLLSIPASLVAGVHAWMVGSSASSLWFRILLAILLGAVTYPGVLRLFSVFTRRARSKRRHSVGVRPIAQPTVSRVAR